MSCYTLLAVFMIAWLPLIVTSRSIAPLITIDCMKEQWPKSSDCTFRCPDNSCVKPTAKCVNSFDDCECSRFYMKTTWGTCEPDKARQCLSKQPGRTSDRDGCDYVCPPNSCMREGVVCLKKFDQCECLPDYKPTLFTNRCVPRSFEELQRKRSCIRRQVDPKPGCDFICPEYSCVRRNTECVSNIRDCLCEDGFIMNRLGQCQRWGSGRK